MFFLGFRPLAAGGAAPGVDRVQAKLDQEIAGRRVIEQAAREQRSADGEKVAAAEKSKAEAEKKARRATELAAACDLATREKVAELAALQKRVAAAPPPEPPKAKPVAARHVAHAKGVQERALGRARDLQEKQKARRAEERRRAAEKKDRLRSKARPAPVPAVPAMRGGLRSGQGGGEFVPQGGRRGQGR